MGYITCHLVSSYFDAITTMTFVSPSDSGQQFLFCLLFNMQKLFPFSPSFSILISQSWTDSFLSACSSCLPDALLLVLLFPDKFSVINIFEYIYPQKALGLERRSTNSFSFIILGFIYLAMRKNNISIHWDNEMLMIKRGRVCKSWCLQEAGCPNCSGGDQDRLGTMFFWVQLLQPCLYQTNRSKKSISLEMLWVGHLPILLISALRSEGYL